MFRSSGIACMVLLAAGVPGIAQQAVSPPWSLRTSVFISGNSDRSDPAGYKVYSGIGLAGSLHRKFTSLVGMELSARTESREVDLETTTPVSRLGSLELMPLDLLVQLAVPPGKSPQPYIGAGVNLTMAWEKTGVLDSMDVSSSVGPAIQLGIDFPLGDRAILNLDARWNRYRTDVSNQGIRMVRLTLDPLRLSVGVGFRF